MIPRDEMKSLLDQLPESSLETVERTIRHLLMRHTAETRFQTTETEEQAVGRSWHSGWSEVYNGVRVVGGQSFHRVEDGNLTVETLYFYEGHDVEISKKFSLAGTKLLCRLSVSSGGVTLRHDDEFPTVAKA